MTHPQVRYLQRRAQARRALVALAFALPTMLAATLLVWRGFGSGAAWLVLGGAVVALLLALALRWRAVDALWLARRLDQVHRGFDDSAALAFARDADLNPLQRLQRERVLQELAACRELNLRERWPNRPLAAVAIPSLLLAAIALGWPKQDLVPDTAVPSNPVVEATATQTTLQSVSLAISPPSYTGVSARRMGALDAKVEQDASVAWRLRFDPQPQAAHLAFHDGTALPLTRDGEEWTAQRALPVATLYRVVVEASAPFVDEDLHRLDVIPDRAPEVRVLRPERTLTLLENAQRRWPLEFEASDDYGLGDAALRITLAQGTGEQIAVSERTLVLSGEGDAQRRRYRYEIDLMALGIAAGDDVIARLTVRDQRVPDANQTRTASFILRWPPEQMGEASGVEGLVQKTMPAYFRSQRQIIIDTEALIGERARLADDDFLQRSDGIGVDQRVLRLRYGQFLGEEDESLHEHEEGAAAASGDARDEHEQAPAPAGFGAGGNVLTEFGHAHDIAEAATLLDPETRKLLKAALQEMWSAELHLRQGAPKLALPFEYRALEFIKRVQQADRIYLARVGLELPPVEESRRLTGDRTGLRTPPDVLQQAESGDEPIAPAWAALQRGETPDIAALTQWLNAHPERAGDPLAVLTALDRLQRDTACAACREAVLRELWPLLPEPPAQVAPRRAHYPSGRAYLDALSEPAP